LPSLFLRSGSGLGLGPAPLVGAGAAATGTGAGARSSAPGAGARPGAVALLLDELDPATVQIGVVQLVQRVLHVVPASKLDNALSRSLVMGVGVRDLSALSHEVLEVLPRSAGRQILHNQPVSGFPAGRVAPPAGRGSPAVGEARVLGVLQPDPGTQLASSVQIPDSIVGVPAVVEVDKSVVTLEDNVGDPAVALEELLDVPVPQVLGQVAHVYLVVFRHPHAALVQPLL